MATRHGLQSADDRPPFPRVAVATTQSIIDHLKTVEEKLQEVMVALDLTHPPRQ